MRGKRVVVVDETGKGEANKSESLLIQRARIHPKSLKIDNNLWGFLIFNRLNG